MQSISLYLKKLLTSHKFTRLIVYGRVEDNRGHVWKNYLNKGTRSFFLPQNRKFNVRIVYLFFKFRLKLIQSSFLFK